MKKLIIICLTCYILSPGLYAQYDIYGKWARKTGMMASNYESDIAVGTMITDSQGNVYVSGQSFGIVSLSDDTCVPLEIPGVYRPNDPNDPSKNNARDGFVSKYDNTGKWQWSVTVSTDVLDNAGYMALSADETKLVFITGFAYMAHNTTIPLGANSKIVYGDNSSEALPISPLGGWGNGALVGVNTNDGSKAFFINVGAYGLPEATGAGALYAVGNYFYFQYYTKYPANGPFYMYARQYDFNGSYINQSATYITNQYPGGTYALSVNPNLPYVYSLIRHGGNVLNGSVTNWFYSYKIYKTDTRTNTTTAYSRIATTYDYSDPVNYSRYGIWGSGMALNNANTHLFLTGYTTYSFNYEAPAGPGTVTNLGGSDGIIVYYDPSKSDATSGHVRWMVNLRAVGNQSIAACVYDNDANLLRVCGYIDENVVNFNPRGTAMNYKADRGNAGFYAVYDDNGICKYVTIMDGAGAGNGAIQSVVQPNQDEIVLFGTFRGSPFPVDPANKITPLRSTDGANFIAKYSLTEIELDTPFNASYGASDNVTETYGIARHEILGCLSLGVVNSNVSYQSGYVPQFYKGGTVNPNYDSLEGIQIGTGTSSNEITVKVEAQNSKITTASLAGWIDFNQNGVFDADEVSNIVTIPANTNSLTEYSLTWTLPTRVASRFSTFMRIRLTSERMDGTWFAGDAADGEVEDYRVAFNFTVPVNPHARITGQE